MVGGRRVELLTSAMSTQIICSDPCFTIEIIKYTEILMCSAMAPKRRFYASGYAKCYHAAAVELSAHTENPTRGNPAVGS
jgi:hypothetical protein